MSFLDVILDRERRHVLYFCYLINQFIDSVAFYFVIGIFVGLNDMLYTGLFGFMFRLKYLRC